MKQIFVLLSLAYLICIAGCGGTSVTRVEATQTIDVSGRWNDTDSQLVATEMIKDVLSRPWIDKFTEGHSNKQPTVIVGEVTNKSHEHISTETFINDLQRELINSGKVVFVASRKEREEVREERKDQQYGFTSSETTKKFGEETGADFMLKGSINTILDEAEGKRVTYYQVDLELIDIETNSKAWIGQKKIKKVIDRPGTKW